MERRSGTTSLGFFIVMALVFALDAASGSVPTAPDLVLITLDTVRADVLGAYGGAARTPVLDGIAARGVRFEQAMSPVPLTLPAHGTMLTGLDPAESGLRDNGVAALPKSIPTIAEALRARGYSTIAVVGSRVLDRRFGLERGFDTYDDRMLAERLGEFGYAERPAREVVDVALAAAARAAPNRPLFLWVHFYDPHAPYEGSASNPRDRYHQEIEAVDREIGRLLQSLRPDRPRWVVAVADHGESFGEHGENEHGYLLHQPTLHVPLLVQGPDLPKGSVVRTPVAIQRIAATLAFAGGVPAAASKRFGLPLQWRDGGEAAPIYHETLFPASTFGWSSLFAVTSGHWRLVDGPRPALYDLATDPGELKNRLSDQADVGRKLRRELRDLRARPSAAPEPIAPDPELRAALAGLGYLSGASSRSGDLDPSEGLPLLTKFAHAKEALTQGRVADALSLMRELVAKSPQSGPFRTTLGAAEKASGDLAAARRSLAAALEIQPANEFVWTMIGDMEREAGNLAAAEKALREAVRLNPRQGMAWLSLGQLLARSGRADEELAALRAAVKAECESGTIHARLAEIELSRGDFDAAERDAARAVELLPQWSAAWRVWANVAERRGDLASARERRRRASELGG
jgi:arylsulfatase A-like enzyme/Flp pilus assembly protein TadD